MGKQGPFFIFFFFSFHGIGSFIYSQLATLLTQHFNRAVLTRGISEKKHVDSVIRHLFQVVFLILAVYKFTTATQVPATAYRVKRGIFDKKVTRSGSGLLFF